MKCIFVGKWKINWFGFCKFVLNFERERLYVFEE